MPVTPPDFRRQIIELSAAYAPDRLIIEPTGLATIGQIMAVLAKEDVQLQHCVTLET